MNLMNLWKWKVPKYGRGTQNASEAITFERLLKISKESSAFVPHLTERESQQSFREVLDERLTVLYHEDGRWRINYRRPNGSVMSVNNRMDAEMARVQIRGITNDFAESVKNGKR